MKTLALENYGVEVLSFYEMQEIDGGVDWAALGHDLGVAAHEAWNDVKKAFSDAGDAFSEGLKKGATTPIPVKR